MKINSDWRCPKGNAAVDGTIGSWHMEGNGGDFAKKNGAALTQAEYTKLRRKALDLGALSKGISKYGTSGTFTYTRWIHIDWRS